MISCQPWIKKNCYFPPGSHLQGKVCGEHLLPFQIEILKEVENGKSIFLYGMRKVSKSLLYAWIIYHRLATDKVAFFCPLLASSFDQAGIIFKMIRFQCESSNKHFKTRKNFIENPKSGSVVMQFSGSNKSAFGYQPSAVVADELSNWKDFETLEAIESGFGLSDKPPLRLYASNPPDKPIQPVLEKLKECEKDKNFYVRRFCAEPSIGKDVKLWGKPENWHVNPFINSHFTKQAPKFPVLLDFYKKRCRSAKKDKIAEVNFLRYQLGITVFNQFKKFLSTEKIKIVDESVYKDDSILWSIGLDISVSRDMTAVVICGQSPDESVYFKPFIYLPNLENRRTTHAYKFKNWDKAGFLKIQNKPVTHRGSIVKELLSYVEKNNIKIERVIMDRFQSEFWVEDFSEWPIEKVATGPSMMTMPIRELQRACHAEKLSMIGANDCMLWNIQNCLVSDQSKNWVSLKRSDNKESNIDGAIALCLASSWLFKQGSKRNKGFFSSY